MKKNIWFFIVDFILVYFFAGKGRSSHHKSINIIDIWATAWPFVLGLLVGWGVAFVVNLIASKDYSNHSFNGSVIIPNGILIWLGTIIIGMLFRYFFHDEVNITFVCVATSLMAVMLIGWRLIYLGFTTFRSKNKI